MTKKIKKMDNLLDKYLFQAIDAYPYDLQETVETPKLYA